MCRFRHDFLKLDTPLESLSSEEEESDPYEVTDAVLDAQLPIPDNESETVIDHLPNLVTMSL